MSPANNNLKVIGWAAHGLGATVVLATILFFLLGIARPLEQQRQSLLAEDASLVELLATAQEVRNEHMAVKSELHRLREQKTLLRNRVTDGACEDEFLRQVTRAAGDANLQLREYRPVGVTRHGHYGVMQIQLNCEGTYPSICTFLHELGRLARLTNVQRLHVSSSSNSEVYPVTMTVEIYFAAPPTSTKEGKHA